jgi:hypothetical protein
MVNFQKIPANILRPWVNASTTAGDDRENRSRVGPSECLEGGEDLLGVAGHGDFRPHAGNALVGADQESRPHDPHELAAVHRLLLPNAIGLEHAMGFIRTERNRQLVLGLELILCRERLSPTRCQPCQRLALETRRRSAIGLTEGYYGAPMGPPARNFCP